MPLRLLIGNKNYSSWSLRPWLAMKAAGIAFEETLIPLGAPDFRAKVSALSGGEGRGSVPVLIDGDIHVWETLAILEYLAEKFPEARLWPQARCRSGIRARDLGRDAFRLSAAAASLADECAPAGETARPGRSGDGRRGADRRDMERKPCRFGAGGAFLFGRFGAADAMYAPVVWRFHTYAVEVSAAARDYMRAVIALPASVEWREAARRESWVLEHDEVDWPDAPRE